MACYMKTFKQIIGHWASHADMASDLNVRPNTIAVWSHRNRIPSEYWTAIVSSETASQNAVTLEVLADLSAANRV